MELLKKLVRIPTVNSENGDQIIKVILNELPNVEYKVYEFEGIKNLVVWNRGKGPLLCLNGHYDVVPVSEGWSKDPFGAEIEEGKLYGRGASDMKGGLAANVLAFKELAKQDKNIMLMVVGDEEKGGKRGTKSVLDQLDIKPQYALITEPMQGDYSFGDTIKIGRRGVYWFEIIITGTPGHASQPQKAKNPADAVSLLFSYIQNLKLDDAPDMIPTTIVPTKIVMDGGAPNVIPREVSITMDMRYNYNVNPENVAQHMVEMLTNAGYKAKYNALIKEPAFFNKDKLFLSTVQKKMKSKDYLAKPSTTGGSSDARFFAAKDIPVLEVGPRAFNIHSTDEYVVIDDLTKLTELLVDIGRSL